MTGSSPLSTLRVRTPRIPEGAHPCPVCPLPSTRMRRPSVRVVGVVVVVCVLACLLAGVDPAPLASWGT